MISSSSTALNPTHIRSANCHPSENIGRHNRVAIFVKLPDAGVGEEAALSHGSAADLPPLPTWLPSFQG